LLGETRRWLFARKQPSPSIGDPLSPPGRLSLDGRSRDARIWRRSPAVGKGFFGFLGSGIAFTEGRGAVGGASNAPRRFVVGRRFVIGSAPHGAAFAFPVPSTTRRAIPKAVCRSSSTRSGDRRSWLSD
jgi:hypothetical protein